MSERVQPPEMIGPMAGPQAGEEEPLDQAKQDYKQGRELLTKGEYPQAAIAFHNALKGFEEQGNQHGVANASDRLGDVCLAREEYGMALDNYKRAYAICEKEEDSFSLVALNKKMASAYDKMGDHDAALRILLDMVEHYYLTKNPKGATETLERLAEVYQQMGEKRKAADTYRTIASIHANFKHKRLAGEYEQKAAALEQA